MFENKGKGGKDGKPKASAGAQPGVEAGDPGEPRAPAAQVARRVRLGELDRADLRFFLRDPKLLQEDHLKDLLNSLQQEGLQAPVEFFRDGPKKVLVKGHRRVAACAVLARKGLPGFQDDMELDAVEVLEADPSELLVRCVLDNCVRQALDQVDRIRAARRLFLARVPEARAAAALGVSTQSYKRDLLIAEDPWMFGHVEANHVSPTPAATILRAVADAAKEFPGIRDQVREDLDAWVEAKRRWIDHKDRFLKAKKGRGRGLSEADKQVKRYLSGQLAEHWADLTRRGEPLDDAAEWTFQADLNPETDLLQIGGVRLNLAKDPARKLAEVATKLSQLAKDLGPFLQKRYQEERMQRLRTTGRAVVRDTQYLKDLGLADLAAQFEAELAEAGPDGAADPDFDREEPRRERDLADEADAPDDDRTPDEGPAATAGADDVNNDGEEVAG